MNQIPKNVKRPGGMYSKAGCVKLSGGMLLSGLFLNGYKRHSHLEGRKSIYYNILYNKKIQRIFYYRYAEKLFASELDDAADPGSVCNSIVYNGVFG